MISTTKRAVFNAFISLALVLLAYACGDEAPPPPPPVPIILEDDLGIDEELEELNELDDIESDETTDYSVILSVDSIIKVNQNGILKIWIGSDALSPETESGMVADETTIPSTIGNYATITPFAPDFEIVDYDNTECHFIEPSGSSVFITLKPKNSGSHRVGAVVRIFKDTLSCNGPSVSKTSRTLSVQVVVDHEKELEEKRKERKEKMEELGTIFWDKFVIFWGALIALVLGTIFFLIKRKIKKKTGYDHEE